MRHQRPTFTLSMIVRTIIAWSVTLLLFFPLGWMALTAFKTELQAIAVPPLVLFEPTLENFTIVQERSEIGRASCRERVPLCVDLGGRRIIKKKKTLSVFTRDS